MSEGNKVFGLLFAVLLVGCGQAHEPTLSTEPALEAPLQRAIDIWNPLIASCGRSLKMVADSSDFRVYYGNAGTDADGYPYPATTFQRYGEQSTVVISHVADSSADGLVKILTHELGHVLGSDDSRDEHDIMFGGPNGVTIPTQNDIDAVCSH